MADSIKTDQTSSMFVALKGFSVNCRDQREHDKKHAGLDDVQCIRETERMQNSDWPRMIPPDLRSPLDAVLGARYRPLAADVWTELREWLMKHKAEPPAELPQEKPSRGPADIA